MKSKIQSNKIADMEDLQTVIVKHLRNAVKLIYTQTLVGLRNSRHTKQENKQKKNLQWTRIHTKSNRIKQSRN